MTLTSRNSRRAATRSRSSIIARDVDGDELGDVRRGERRGHHRRRGVLAHALDRDAGLAAPGRAGVVELTTVLGRPLGGLLDVVARHRAVRAGRRDRGEVDAERLGELAHRRLGEHAVARARARRRSGWAGARRRRRCTPGRPVAADSRTAGRTRPAARGRCAAGAAGAGAARGLGARAVADERHLLLAAGGGRCAPVSPGTAGVGSCGRRPPGRARRVGRRRRSR